MPTKFDHLFMIREAQLIKVLMLQPWNLLKTKKEKRLWTTKIITAGFSYRKIGD